jgi:hypothetical protein
MMNTSLTRRFAAALASATITFSLFSAVVAEAEPPVSGPLLAQVAAAPAVR